MRNKLGGESATPSEIEPAIPPLSGSRFPEDAGTELCAGGAPFCDFGDHSAPQLTDLHVGDLDNSASWSAGDYLRLSFDRATNRAGAAEQPN